MCAKVEGSPFIRSIPQLAQEFDKSEKTMKEAVRTLYAHGDIKEYDRSWRKEPKITMKRIISK